MEVGGDFVCCFLNPHHRTCLLILERGEGGRWGEGEKRPLVGSCLCPDPGSKPQPFGSPDDAPAS